MDINDLKRGSRIVLDGDPHLVLFAKHVHIGRGGAHVQTKVRNLKTGKVFERNFKGAESFEEADLKKMGARFQYEKRGEYWFHEEGKPANRFLLSGEALGEKARFLKPNMEVTALIFKSGGGEEEIINIDLPIKAEYVVLEAPPSVRGGTAQGGTKTVTIEGGVKVQTPLFVEAGDKIRVNTETGEYVERAG